MTFKTWFYNKFNPKTDKDWLLYKYEFDLIYDSYVSECKKQGVMYQKKIDAFT